MTAQARMHRKALTRWNFKAVSSLRAVSMARDRTPKRRCEVAKPLADTVERITMFRACVVCLGMLLPAAAMACESGDRRTCMEQFRMLIAYRTQAIEAAFGDLFGGLPEEIEIRFVTSRDREYDHLAGRLAYDPKRRMLIFPRRVLSAKTPNPLRWASYYWPFYQDERYQNEFPIIGEIDTLLWNAYLQEAALAEGLNWPHRECVSARMSERLPCEMLIKGVAEHVKAVNGPLFNQNRIDRIWPEDFREFERRVWRRSDQEYLDVQRYGGILLAQPLIDEFGVLRAIAYMAQTPFHIEDNNMRLSALRYQERAREALNANPDRALPGDRLSVHARDRRDEVRNP